MIKGTNTVVSIAMPPDGGPASCEVPATVYGQWAVHKTVRAMHGGEPEFGDGYYVTHVPSGMKLTGRITKKAKACALAMHLAESLPLFPSGFGTFPDTAALNEIANSVIAYGTERIY